MMEKQNKKKIAFFISRFEVGGTEKAFLNLLNAIDRNKYEVIVYLPEEKGAWEPILREKCEVRRFVVQKLNSVLRLQLSNKNIFGAVKSLTYRILSRLYYKKDYIKYREYLIRSMPAIDEKLDCAVSFCLDDDCVLACIFCTIAKSKVAWVHGRSRSNERCGCWYSMFDRIFCVSENVREEMQAKYPHLGEKLDVLYNIIYPEQIKKMAQCTFPDMQNNGEIALTTVGRLSKEKGQDIIPRTARILLDAGYDIKWYLVGDGNLREKVEQEIEREKVGLSVILVGNQDNPYPYMRVCDIYVQTSRYEGWGLTVSEAKALFKPIVTTDAHIMTKQIDNGINGIIVERADPDLLAAGIQRLIEHPQLRADFTKQLKKERRFCDGGLEKLYAMID